MAGGTTGVEAIRPFYYHSFLPLDSILKDLTIQTSRSIFFSSLERRFWKRMKLRKQVTVCGGAIFCVAVFSLYLMLDRVQHDPARRQSGGNFPRVRVITVFLKHAENILSEKPLFLKFLLLLFFVLFILVTSV